MVKIFIIFLITIIILGMLVGVAVAIQGKDRLKNPYKGLDNSHGEDADSGSSEEDLEADFYDDKGNHIYYERSLIKKRKYAREHPDEASGLRTFRRLFSGKK